MNKKLNLFSSLMILSSLVLAACSSLTEGVESGSAGSTLPTQAQTEVASIVNQASKATQNAAGTPVIAGPSGSEAQGTATQRGSTGAAGNNQTPASTCAGKTPAATQGATARPGGGGTPTPAPTEVQATPGIMEPVLDWSTPWADLLRNLPGSFYTISVEELANEINTGTQPFLVDVRDQDEVAEYGYIKGAVNIPYDQVFNNLDNLPARDQWIVVYSGVGHRGTIILSALRLLGYTNVFLLDGGMSSWLSAGQPAESGTPPSPVPGATPDVDQAKISDLKSFIATGTYGVEANSLNDWIYSDIKPLVVDVRERTESSTNGAIGGSLQVPLRTLFDNLSDLPADKASPIVIVDSNGHRGTMAMMALRMIGYTNVRSLFGGYNAWVEAGLPVVR
jgi:rhodanese-related sulfurtransferase